MLWRACRDPYTGQKSLLYHTRFFHCFKGYTRAQSRDIIEEVLLPAIAPENTYRHEWRNGDFIAWCAPVLQSTTASSSL